MTGIFKIIGWGFILLGIMMAGLMGIMVVDGPPLTDPAGVVWLKFDGYSLGQFQVLVQRTLGLPDIWDKYVVPVLRAPAWQGMIAVAALAFLLGIIFLFSARSRARAGIIHQGGHMS
jgi:hypothetical protein